MLNLLLRVIEKTQFLRVIVVIDSCYSQASKSNDIIAFLFLQSSNEPNAVLKKFEWLVWKYINWWKWLTYIQKDLKTIYSEYYFLIIIACIGIIFYVAFFAISMVLSVIGATVSMKTRHILPKHNKLLQL